MFSGFMMMLNTRGKRRFQGRQTRRGKGKVKRKGEGIGGRRYFKTRRSKGQGKGRRKGRSHMVGEEGYEEEWQEEEEEEEEEEEDWNDSWGEGYWADDQDWNDGYWATEELYYKDEYGYFQKKAKERKERKARKARMMKEKEVNQEMEKASQTFFNRKLHRLLPFRNDNNSRLIFLLQPQVQGMVFRFLC